MANEEIKKLIRSRGGQAISKEDALAKCYTVRGYGEKSHRCAKINVPYSLSGTKVKLAEVTEEDGG